jgi:DNA integrity scanning protein DisA with diadenylate cyclase activity
MSQAMTSFYYEHLNYYLKQNAYIIRSAEFEIQTAIQYTSRVANACKANGKPELAEEINMKLEGYYTDYVKTIQPDLK